MNIETFLLIFTSALNTLTLTYILAVLVVGQLSYNPSIKIGLLLISGHLLINTVRNITHIFAHIELLSATTLAFSQFIESTGMFFAVCGILYYNLRHRT